MDAEVGALGEVVPQQAVRVLVRASHGSQSGCAGQRCPQTSSMERPRTLFGRGGGAALRHLRRGPVERQGVLQLRVLAHEVGEPRMIPTASPQAAACLMIVETYGSTRSLSPAAGA